ncbi:MAG: hypothetical protein EA378_06270 [Phycisphaerales bacterium]|nr:MAG: hypothetical protein EA378_06270 [Phycisphaerales bacterium]
MENADARRIELWRTAMGSPELLASAAGVEGAASASGVARVRAAAARVLGGSGGEAAGGELARVALTIAEGRRRLAGKWHDSERAVADSPGAQMASGTVAARWKAARFARAMGDDAELVLDLCCGIGGDLRELATTLGGRVPVVGVEVDSLRGWMASENSPGAQCRCGEGAGDATGEGVSRELAGALVHLDPSRREGGGRRRRGLGELTPGVGFVERVARAALGAGIKLAPSVDAHELPGGELEVLSEDGRLTQAVLWTGRLAPDGHGVTRATVLRRDGGREARSMAASLDQREAAAVETTDAEGASAALVPGAVVWAVDPSVERAGLLGVLASKSGGIVGHPGAGLIVGGDAREDEGWARGYELVDRCVWARDRVAGLVRTIAGDAGPVLVEVKTRGGVIDADRERAALRPRGARGGGAELTVFVQRLFGAGSPVEALITRRMRV